MKIALTGASGFVGGHIARALAADGHQILAFSRRILPEIANMTASIWNLDDAWQSEVPEIDIFIHAAAITELGANYGRAKDINVGGTRHAYQYAKAAGAKRFIHISSASVYNSALDKHRVDESFEKVTAIDNSYARTKYEAEEFLAQAKAMPITILRPHIVYGPGDTKVLYELLAKVHSNVLSLPINGNYELSVTHVGNIVAAVRFFLDQKLPGVEAYNVADKDYVDSLSFINALLDCSKNRPVIKLINPHIALAAAMSSEFFGKLTGRMPLLSQNLLRQLNQDSSMSMNKLSAMGFKPTHELEDGIKDITVWLASFGSIQDYLAASQSQVWPATTKDYIY